jgi:hypothetical protein
VLDGDTYMWFSTSGAYNIPIAVPPTGLGHDVLSCFEAFVEGGPQPAVITCADDLLIFFDGNGPVLTDQGLNLPNGLNIDAIHRPL